VYAIGRQGIAKRSLTDESTDLTPLLDTILEKVEPAKGYSEGEVLRAQVFNLGYDNFLGRLAIARIYEGELKFNQNVFILHKGQEPRRGKVTKLFTFKGIERVESDTAYAGDIVIVAGFPNINIGETLSDIDQAQPLDAIAVDQPTIALDFVVNNSPFAGREGKYVTTVKSANVSRKSSKSTWGFVSILREVVIRAKSLDVVRCTSLFSLKTCDGRV
jgi:GTP-binding protein